MTYYIVATFMSVLISTLLSPINNQKVIRRDSIRLLIDKKSLNYNFILVLSLLPLLLVATLRYYVGTDYRTYMVYQIPAIMSNRTDITFEYLFQVLVKFAENILGSPHWVFSIISTLFIFLVYGYISRFSEDIPLSIFLFVGTIFYNYSFNIIRQSLATAAFLFSIKYIKESNLKKYILLITVATLFHTSAIIYFPFYFILQISFNKKKYVPIIIFIALVMKDQIRFGLVYICEKSGVYLSYLSSTYDNGGSTYNVLIFLNIFLLLIATYLVQEQDNEETKLGRIFYNSLFMSTVITLLSPIIPNNIRIIFMFFPITIVYIPYMINRLKVNLPKNLVKIMCVSFFILFFMYFISNWNWGETLPYQTIFSS